MTNGQAVQAERQTLKGALIEPRPPLEDVGPLRGGSAFSSPLWQTSGFDTVPSGKETPIGEIARPSNGPGPQDSAREDSVGQETGSVGSLLEAAPCGWFDEATPTLGRVDQEPAPEVEAAPGVEAAAGAGFDAPTEVFDVPLVKDAAEPKRRTSPWPPSPWPRNATSPTVRIRLADLLPSAADGVDPGVGKATDLNQSPAAAAATIKLASPFNARTILLTLTASLVMLCGGALFAGPMGAVTIAPDPGPTSATGHAPRISGASVVPAALLARTPAPDYPASIERLDALTATPAAKPSAPAAEAAAMSGIPGMMGTLLPVSAPGRVGMHPDAPATALSTAAH